MMGWEAEMAVLIKSKGKSALQGSEQLVLTSETSENVIMFGTVKETNPLKIMIFDGNAFIGRDELIFTRSNRSSSFIQGDELILIPLNNLTKFLFLEKKG